jgi:hypothetical protein
MSKDRPSPARLRDLVTDLAVERRRLEALVDSLEGLAQRWEREGADAERVDAAALRLQSFGATPEGSAWHRRLLDRLTQPTDRRPALLSDTTSRALGQWLGFRHLVLHLYADDLDPQQVRQRLVGALELWPTLSAELETFHRWLAELIAFSEGVAEG